jgi:ATP-dependent Lon protease
MKKENLLFDAGVGDVNILPVVNMDSIQNLDEKELPEVLPILTLRNAVLFPATVIPIAVGREKSIKLVRDAYKSGKILGAVAQMDNEVEHPQ